jgi:hypothetical protein
LNVSELKPEPTTEPITDETGTVVAGLAAADMSAPAVPLTAAAEIGSNIASEQEEVALKPDVPKSDAPEAESPKAEAPKVEVPKVEAPKVEAPKVDAGQPEAPFPGKVTIISPGDRAGAKADADEATPGKRRIAAMAAVVALATVAGALGGALATAGLTTGFGHMMGREAAASNNSALEASVARIDADIAALKTSVEHTSKMGMSQFNKTSDRLDRVEKAQAEPAAKLAKLSEAVDKLRTASAAAAAAPVAAKDVTGSITPSATAAASAPAAPPRPDVLRLPTVEGWVLRDVANGGALIEGRRGVFEVYAGDPVPGLGRVDAIRRQDGRWVVVTSKGLIVAR